MDKIIIKNLIKDLSERKSKKISYIKGRDKNLYGTIDLDGYLTTSDAESLYATLNSLNSVKDELESEIQQAGLGQIYWDIV